MAEERLRRNLDTALEPGPDFPSPLWLSRTMAGLAVEAPARTHRPGRLRQPKWLVTVVAVCLVLAILVTLVASRVLLSRQTIPSNEPQLGTVQLPIGREWILSARDAAVIAGQSDELEITHDGGRTWLRSGIRISQFNTMSLRWLDPKHIVIIRDSAGPPYIFDTSSDGGAHWQSSRLSFPAGTESAFTFFLNASEGWTLCESTDCAAPEPAACQGQYVCVPRVLYHTVDSGSRWQLIGSDFTLPWSSVFGLLFTDSKHGFMSTSNADGVGRLLVTGDGGHTWEWVQLPPPPGGWPGRGSSPTSCTYSTCVLLPAMFGQQGVTVVETSIGNWFTYTTTDGGITWANPRSLPVEQPHSMFEPWHGAVDPREWWAVSATGKLYRTADAGATWVRIEATLPSDYALTNVKPAGGDVLWGTSGGPEGLLPPGPPMYLLRSIDAGKSWTVVVLPAA
jgi:photosystem II stability/assembly factor-like uncharacterized protein